MIDPADLYAADLGTAVWMKSSYTANNGQCVEIARIPGLAATAIRDSKNTPIPAIRVSDVAWSDFVRSTATGDLDEG